MHSSGCRSRNAYAAPPVRLAAPGGHDRDAGAARAGQLAAHDGHERRGGLVLGQHEGEALVAAGLDQVNGTAASRDAEQVWYPVALERRGTSRATRSSAGVSFAVWVMVWFHLLSIRLDVESGAVHTEIAVSFLEQERSLSSTVGSGFKPDPTNAVRQTVTGDWSTTCSRGGLRTP